MNNSRVPPDIAQAVVSRVVYGDYGSVDAVLRAALASLDETEAATASIYEVRGAIADAIIRGESNPSISADVVIADFQQVFAELEARRAVGIEQFRAEILVGLADLDAGRGVDGERPCAGSAQGLKLTLSAADLPDQIRREIGRVSESRGRLRFVSPSLRAPVSPGGRRGRCRRW